MIKIFLIMCCLWASVLRCDVAFAQQLVTLENVDMPFDTLSGAFLVKDIEKISEHVFCLKVGYAPKGVDKSEYRKSDLGIFDVAICDTLYSYKKAKRMKGKRCFMKIVSLFPVMSSSCMFEKMDVDFYDAHFSNDDKGRINPKYYVVYLE